MWIIALLGLAISVAGKITSHSMNSRATDEAIAQGAENLKEGQTVSAQNAAALAQDNMYALALSGVSASEGTASQLDQQVKLQSTATINKMSQDYDAYVRKLRLANNADAANTAFSIAGDVFGAVGRIAYDNARINAQNGYDIGPVSPLSDPSMQLNQQFITPLGARRLGSLTIPQAPTSFNWTGKGI